jgi:hypothetical protein
MILNTCRKCSHFDRDCSRCKLLKMEISDPTYVADRCLFYDLLSIFLR